jgi:hypothetical protein
MTYTRVKAICDWRLGRETLIKEKRKQKTQIQPLTVNEIMACLKRIRKSVETWTRESGRQGYLLYISQFL